MRRAAVVVLGALVVSGCAGGPPLRQGFGAGETTTPPPSTQTVVRVMEGRSTSSAVARPVRDPKSLATPKTALVADGLEVQESSAEISTAPLTLCGSPAGTAKPVKGQRIVTKSTSGATRLEQDIAVYGGNEAAAALQGAKCAGAEKMTLTAKNQVGWCEPRAGGRGACAVLVAGDDVLVSLKLETISVDRARDLVTRLAAATPVK